MGRPKKLPEPLTDEPYEKPLEQPEEVNETPEPDTGEKWADVTFSKEKEMIHHVVKLLPAIGTKNMSYKANSFIPGTSEHAHFFHSIGRRGEALDMSSAMWGHSHKVEFIEKDGKVSVKVGPALEEITVQAGEGRKLKKWVKKRLRGEIKDQVSGEQVESAIYDDHTHDWEYLNAEKVTVAIK